MISIAVERELPEMTLRGLGCRPADHVAGCAARDHHAKTVGQRAPSRPGWCRSSFPPRGCRSCRRRDDGDAGVLLPEMRLPAPAAVPPITFSDCAELDIARLTRCRGLGRRTGRCR